MKKLIVVLGLSAVGLFSASTPALAACSGKKVSAKLLEGYTLCTSRGDDSWQEYHGPGGKLIDYKMGPNDKVDPTKEVGTWATKGTSVTYTFGSSSSTYGVFEAGGGRYCMDGTDGAFAVTFRKGLSKCAGTPPVLLPKGNEG